MSRAETREELLAARDAAAAHAAEASDYADRYKAENDRLRSAVLGIDAHATPFSKDDDGFITRYLLTAGALHRALGVVGHSAAPCPACRTRPHPGIGGWDAHVCPTCGGSGHAPAVPVLSEEGNE